MKNIAQFLVSILMVSSLILPTALAQSISNQDKSEVSAVIQQLEAAVNQGDADSILGLMSPQADPALRTAIEDAIAGKTITFSQEIVSFEPASDGDVRVTGRFSAEGDNWSISGFGNEFLLRSSNGEWKLLNTNFHQQFQPSGILSMFLKIGAMIFLPFIVLGVFWLWMLIDVLRRPLENKVVWLLAIIFLNILGALIYFFSARRSHKRQLGQQMGIQPSSGDTWVFLLLLLTFFGSIAWAGYSFWSLIQSTGMELSEPTPSELSSEIERENPLIPPREQDFQPFEAEQPVVVPLDESEADPPVETTEDGAPASASESGDEPIESTFEVTPEVTSEAPPAPEETREPGVNARGDRIYLDEDTNVWIEYKSGETLQLTKNASTTKGCGSKVLYYKAPVELSNDSQFALLPLYCEGDPTEIWVKEIDTARSGLVTYAEAASFLEEDGETKIKAGDATFYNIMDRDTHFYSPEKGISVHIKDGYTVTDFGDLEFGPVSQYGEWGDHHNYQMTIVDAKTAEQVIADHGPDYSFYTIAPHRITVGDFTVVLSEEPGMCTVKTYEVIGEKHNYRFSPFCLAGEQGHDAYIREVISTIHFIK